MIVKDYALTVNFDKGIKYPAMRFVKGDSQSCAFNFSIVQDITDLSLVVTFKLPDETSYIQGAEIKGPHEAYLMLPSDVLSQVGKVLCQVAIHNDGRLTNAVPFSYLVVEDFAEGGGIEASDNLPILTQLITECSDIIEAEELRALAEALRVENEGAADPPSGRVGAELAREAAEAQRGLDYINSEAARDDAYDAQELIRDGLYSTAESERNNAYQQAEDDRDSLYAAAEAARVLAEGTADPRTGRVGAELDRVDAEGVRASNEVERVSLYNNISNMLATGQLKGDKGDKGEQGIQGEIGPQGPTGKSIEYNWNGTELGVRVEGESSYQYVNLRGPQGEKGDTGEQGPQGEQGETGAPGSSLNLRVNRQYDTYEDLPVSADIGYMCLVGLELHIYTENGWVNAGELTKIDYDLFMYIDGGLFTDESGVEIGESGLEALQNHIVNANTHENLIIDGLEV